MTLAGCGRPALGVVAALLVVSPAEAGVWGADPVLGIVGYGSTNPGLLLGAHNAAASGAVVFDGPVTYDGNAADVSMTPSIRYGDHVGYSGLTSNYEHLTLKGDVSSERDTFSASAALARDSSLYYNFTQNGLAGVARDSATADLNWNRLLTDRLSVATDVNDTRVRYGRPIGAATLVDYSYGVVSPTLSWQRSEKDTLSLAGVASRYKSLDGTTRSTDYNLQAGFLRRVSELWSVKALAGLSRTSNSLDTTRHYLSFAGGVPSIVAVPVELRSSQNSTVFSLDVTRQAQRLALTAAASRQLIPSGFAFLSRQQSYEVSATYTCSERWKLGVDLRFLESQDPSLQGVYTQRTVRFASLTSTWRWTERWTITASATRVTQDIQATAYKPSSTDLSLQLSRRFAHVQF